MTRKRLTQTFPFLLPLRQKQRKLFFYMKMYFDSNKYARKIENELLPYKIFEAASLMLNKNSGFNMKYQMNKVHNLKLAAKTLNGLVIKPNETFSFCKLVRCADRYQSFKDGLTLLDGKIVGSYGGGLCQLSNLLFWMFLHTPLTIVERQGHAVESFPSTTIDLPYGIDATINDGWLDLKVRNDTDTTFQIAVSFDDEFMYGNILSDCEQTYEYEIFNQSISYCKIGGKVFQKASVDCNRIDKTTKQKEHISLYNNICEIGYILPDDIEFVEEGD
ncbi:glycopeptide resistance accessory protein VanW [Clostridium ganghwense]|uniref:Glycopeptide resistance accessory protein VanW n=1 Tax=Clostridium ganghwense TaxID=312089 RepID=A0ABT4CQ77_9CLOT|nr:glycopeptide resistance accessory protein VanW [Clostridium ganghwense]MCY6371200.1 glycopeptide resistance accessory protein VanW [Clostridium ganghwense]